MSKPAPIRPFSLVSNMHDGQRITAARFVCDGCEKRLEFRVSGNLNPEATVKQAASKGWNVALRSAHAECPSCVKARSAARSGDSPNDNSEKVIPMLQPAKPAAVVPRPLTAEERLKIRSALDSHFDDAKGRYLDGYSDQRIAEELKTPPHSRRAHPRGCLWGDPGGPGGDAPAGAGGRGRSAGPGGADDGGRAQAGLGRHGGSARPDQECRGVSFPPASNDNPGWPSRYPR